ncbi:MAG: helix-turn-helix transcriptional regulator [Usitatibacteraceae bacterium]
MSDTTFGKLISEARKTKGLSQKQLASMVTREDGQAISPQYLNDIERDRRLPASEVINELSKHLGISPNYLHLLARKVPDDLPVGKLKEADVERLMVAFRQKLAK